MTEEISAAERRILVGQVVRPHGLTGELVVEPITTNPDRFAVGQRFEARLKSGERLAVEVADARPLGRRLGIRLQECRSRTEAERFRGAELTVDRSDCPVLEAGQVYQFELLGCRCWDRTLGDLGTVVEVVEGGGGWLLLVASEADTKLLLPFVAAFLDEIDLPGHRLSWNLPAGLVETCRFGS